MPRIQDLYASHIICGDCDPNYMHNTAELYFSMIRIVHALEILNNNFLFIQRIQKIQDLNDSMFVSGTQ